MKEVGGSREVFQSMAFNLEEKPSIEESQMSRKSRYFQRMSFPLPAVEETERKRKKKKVIQEDSSDDDMPQQTKRNRKKKLTPKSSSTIIDVVDLVTPSQSPPSIIDLTSDIASDDENSDPIIVENPEPREEPKTSPAPIDYDRVNPFPGRLPKWYHTRKAEREEREKGYAEKREIRLKLEKEAEEVARKQEQIEYRRFMDRLRHQRKRELERMQKALEGEKDSASGAKETSKKARKVDDVEGDGNQKKKKKRVTKTGTMITDPSLDPSSISLGMPELAPWAAAPRKSKKPDDEEAPPTSLEASTESMTMSTTMLTEDEEEIRRNLEELEKDGGLEGGNEIPSMPIDDPLLRFDGPLYFEENPEYLRIPDEEIEEVIEERADDEFTDTFLSYINDDTFPLDELDQYI